MELQKLNESDLNVKIDEFNLNQLKKYPNVKDLKNRRKPYLKANERKGLFGESNTAYELSFLEGTFCTLHRIKIPTIIGTNQIDHIVISTKGIFVIETKNWSFDVFVDKNEWFFKSNGVKRIIRNSPINQNENHTVSLRWFLEAANLTWNVNIENLPFFNIVVFAGDKSMPSEIPNLVRIHMVKRKIYEICEGLPELIDSGMLLKIGNYIEENAIPIDDETQLTDNDDDPLQLDEEEAISSDEPLDTNDISTIQPPTPQNTLNNNFAKTSESIPNSKIYYPNTQTTSAKTNPASRKRKVSKKTIFIVAYFILLTLALASNELLNWGSVFINTNEQTDLKETASISSTDEIIHNQEPTEVAFKYTVLLAYANDVGPEILFMNSEDMKSLQIKDDSTIEIESTKSKINLPVKSHSKVDRGFMRMQESVRNKLGITVNDSVTYKTKMIIEDQK